MRTSWQKGESLLAPILIIAFLIVVMVLTPRSSTPGTTSFFGLTPNATSTTSYNNPNSYPSSVSNGTVLGTELTSSSYKNDISLNRGNAPYSYQPYEEYVTLDNVSNHNIDITGWKLKNAKDKRTYNFNGAEQKFPADIAFIPQATTLYNFSSPLSDIVLKPGDRAIITTGNMPVQTPYRISNFKENICTGYIESHPDYNFTPALNSNCPDPNSEPGVENLDNQCRNFVRFLSRCASPIFEVKDSNGDPCTNCINGQRLSNSCVAFIKEHYTYQGCLAYHSGDTNFEGRTWRVFLGRGWEMWDTQYETIQLFDRLGNLVTFDSY